MRIGSTPATRAVLEVLREHQSPAAAGERCALPVWREIASMLLQEGP
jgi:hypothetical protein